MILIPIGHHQCCVLLAGTVTPLTRHNSVSIILTNKLVISQLLNCSAHSGNIFRLSFSTLRGTCIYRFLSDSTLCLMFNMHNRMLDCCWIDLICCVGCAGCCCLQSLLNLEGHKNTENTNVDIQLFLLLFNSTVLKPQKQFG